MLVGIGDQLRDGDAQGGHRIQIKRDVLGPVHQLDATVVLQGASLVHSALQIVAKINGPAHPIADQVVVDLCEVSTRAPML